MASQKTIPAMLLLACCGLLSCQVVNESTLTPAVDIPVGTGSIIRYDSVHHPVIARHGMVVTQNEIATEIGQSILAQGGNAVDASIAVGFALAVTLPRAGNLGGSGFMLIHDNNSGNTTALDFRSAAPQTVRLQDFLDADGEIQWDDMSFGPKAPGVPGSVAGFWQAWQQHGSLPWDDLLLPALTLAEQGIIVSSDLAFALSEAMPLLSRYPSSIASYAKGPNSSYQTGDLLRQPDLAWSIRQISNHGADAFYTGAIAEKIVSYMEQEEAYISAQDLASYRVKIRQAISTDYRGYQINTMPPSSTGGVAMLQMLNVLEHFPMAEIPQGSAKSLHLIAETMKRVNANRRQGIGDPDFADVPIDGMLSAEMAQAIAKSIDPSQATAVAEISAMDAKPYESRETTHYSIVDRDGNAVSTTYTLGYSFGSGVVVPGTGILLDNQLRNFSHREPGHANAMEPGKRMISTMSPTLVLDPNKDLFLVTGTPGGSRIHTVTLQLLINAIDYKLNIAEATHRPRIYQAWRSAPLGLEQGFSSDTLNLLNIMGHEVELQQTMGSTQSIMRRDGYLYGAADSRRPGALALGVDD